MKNVLRQYWPWIVLATLATVLGVVALSTLESQAESEGFVYIHY